MGKGLEVLWDEEEVIGIHGELGVRQYGKLRHKSIRHQSSSAQLFTEQLPRVGERPFPTGKPLGLGGKLLGVANFHEKSCLLLGKWEKNVENWIL